MRLSVINRVFSEFEVELRKGYSHFNVPIIYPDEQDSEEWVYYLSHDGNIDIHSISGLNGFLESKCTEESYCKLIGDRLFASIEYKRTGKGGNQPRRELFIGEVISIKPHHIEMHGAISSFADSMTTKSKLTEMVKQLVDLDKEKNEFVDKMFNH